MLKQPMIAVRDLKTGLFDRPFTVRHTAEAIREWDIVRKDPQTKFGKNPADFDLFHIADYEDATGHISPCIPPLHLASGV